MVWLPKSEWEPRGRGMQMAGSAGGLGWMGAGLGQLGAKNGRGTWDAKGSFVPFCPCSHSCCIQTLLSLGVSTWVQATLLPLLVPRQLCCPLLGARQGLGACFPSRGYLCVSNLSTLGPIFRLSTSYQALHLLYPIPWVPVPGHQGQPRVLCL